MVIFRINTPVLVLFDGDFASDRQFKQLDNAFFWETFADEVHELGKSRLGGDVIATNHTDAVEAKACGIFS